MAAAVISVTWRRTKRAVFQTAVQNLSSRQVIGSRWLRAVEEAGVVLGADEGAVGEEEGVAAGDRVDEVGQHREEDEDAEDRHVGQQEEGDHAALAGPALEGAERAVEEAGGGRERGGDRGRRGYGAPRTEKASVQWTLARSGRPEPRRRARGVRACPAVVIGPRLPGWRVKRACPGRAGAARFVDGQIGRDGRRGHRANRRGSYWPACVTWSAMSWSMRVKASSRESSPAMTWLVRVTSAA